MRENRLAKLAEMKKMARMVGLAKSEIDKGLALSYQRGFYKTEGGAILYLDANKNWYVAADEVGKITGMTADKFTPVGDNEVYNVTTSTANIDAQHKFKDLRDKAKASAPTTSRASGPQATTAPIKPTTITHAVGTKLKDDSYEYEVMDEDQSFEWIDLKDRSKHGTFSLSQSGTAKWNKAVAALNALTSQASPVAAAPVAAEAPVVTPAATTLDQSLVQKVAAVLQKAEFTPLNIKSGGNEMDQIKSLKTVVGGLIQLAAIIVLRVGDSLTTLPDAKSSDITSGTRKDLAVNMGGRFASDVGIILRQVNEIIKIRNQSKAEFHKLVKSVSITQGTQAPATTAPAAAAADDGQNKSASLNKKFIKAATLRRLKIRSQMEAAIDSSAQMGRARVS